MTSQFPLEEIEDPDVAGKILGHMDSSVAAGIVAVSRVFEPTKNDVFWLEKRGKSHPCSKKRRN